MRIRKIFVVFFLITTSIFSQSGFLLPHKVTSDKVPFKLVNNLVVVPVEVNGTELSFLLDTGVKTTILFGLAQQDTVEVRNVEPIKLRGLGEGGSVDALKSQNNIVKIGKATDVNHTVYVVFEKSLNFSPRMGIPVHGVIGYDFFRKFVVKTNYTSKRLTFYNPKHYEHKPCKSCEEFDLVMKKGKPYIDLAVTHKGQPLDVTLLIDSGSSDALWLFDESYTIVEEPKNYFIDFLGLGLSGNIFGKRSRLDKLEIGDYSLEGVNVAFPNKSALGNIQMYKERDGSLGGDVLKRFTVIMDYPNKRMSLKRNGKFKDPFYYNMSGITVEHDGVIVVEDEKKTLNTPLSYDAKDVNKFAFEVIRKSAAYKLAPKMVVAEVREGSPADLAGIKKGDAIQMVNGKPAHKFDIYQLVELFTSKAGRRVFLQLERNGQIFKRNFVLKKVI